MPTPRFEEGDGSIDRARALRRQETPAERRLWSFLRAGRLDGYKFRRQQRLGRFFAEFICQSVRLIIEVDGPSHDDADAQAYDADRTAFLKGQGYRVIRFANADVLRNPEGAAASIRDALKRMNSPSPARAAHGHPLPLGERG